MIRNALRHLLALSLLCVLIQSTYGENTGESPSIPRPNVLFIAIDDLRTSLGCYGDPVVKSPHIDRFAGTARLFLRAYTQQAVCGPSRTAVLTGRLPDHTRVWHNRNRFRETHPELVTLPQLFKQNGYHTLSLGKVFSGNEKELDPHSWSAPEILREDHWKNYLNPENQGTGKQAAFENENVSDDAYPDGKLTTLAVNSLERLKQNEQPFFLAVGFFKPHLPFNAPRKYWDLYAPSEFDLPDHGGEVHGAPALANHSHRELGGYQQIPEDEQVDAEAARRLRHGYYACVSYVDAQVGQLMEALERLELDDKTIVVLWGDHGFSLGEMNRWCKGTNFERDTRVPLIARTPNMSQPGTATESLIELVDLYPTLVTLAGLTPPDNLDGRSFVPTLDDPRAAGRRVTLSQFNRPWKASAPQQMGYSIRTSTHRYTRWIDWETRAMIAEELYDYTDPTSVRQQSDILIEQANVVSDPTSAETRDLVRATMDELLTTRLQTSLPSRSLQP